MLKFLFLVVSATRRRPMGVPDLSGQVAVVTGAGRGIGAAIAEELAKLGVTVVVSGRTEKTLRETASRIAADGGKAEILECDVCDLGSVEAMAATAEEKFRRIDILVN